MVEAILTAPDDQHWGSSVPEKRFEIVNPERIPEQTEAMVRRLEMTRPADWPSTILLPILAEAENFETSEACPFLSSV